MTDSLPRLLYSQTEAATMLGIGIKLFRSYVDAGQIKYKIIGKRRMFTRADLEEFIQKQKEIACPSTERKSRRTGSMTSRSNIVGFMARREQKRNPSPNA